MVLYLHHFRNMQRSGGNAPILATMRDFLLYQVDTTMQQLAARGTFGQDQFDQMLQSVRNMLFELGLIDEAERGTWSFSTGAPPRRSGGGGGGRGGGDNPPAPAPAPAAA
jgi:hypothetical protein